MQSRETVIRLAAIILLAYMFAAFLGARGRLAAAQLREQVLNESCASLREENAQLSAALSAAPDDAAIATLARERLGLALPGEEIYYFDFDETERVSHGAESGRNP